MYVTRTGDMSRTTVPDETGYGLGDGVPDTVSSMLLFDESKLR